MSQSAMYSGHKLFGCIPSVPYTSFKLSPTLPHGMCRYMFFLLTEPNIQFFIPHYYNVLIKSKKIFKNIKMTWKLHCQFLYEPRCRGFVQKVKIS